MERLLIANRGEIAVRVIRAAKDLGVPTLAIYSEADRGALHAQLADDSVCIGPPAPAVSYLNRDAIITTALAAGCDAIHPGYGFLAEDPEFARACEEHGIRFVGPSASAIARMGDKEVARQTVAAAGVPVVPGSPGAIGSSEVALSVAQEVGYPVLLKARAGGGGRGIRVARTPAELSSAFVTAQSEAAAAFGDDGVYLERFLEDVRHIEFQVLGDETGCVIQLGERDCSIQRRHQKLLEEAPSPVLSPELRSKMGEAAIAAAHAVAYVGAGTVEFLYDQRACEFYFIEMNTRIQVEHAVTEMLTGVDLVAAQLQIADGCGLPLSQEDVRFTGHAIECRINAEDPAAGFAPRPGRLVEFAIPADGPGVRVDTHCFAGASIPPHYDSLIAKVIVHAADRASARRKMKRTLTGARIAGVPTTIPMHLSILDDARFAAGETATNFIDEQGNLPSPSAAPGPARVPA
jgi:acetyl-CoA carboxylase, biotin carboxylase subunit